MNIRTAVLTIPVVLGLGAAGASASTITLAPLGPVHRVVVAALGATCDVPSTPAQANTIPIDYPIIAKKAGQEGTASVGISLSPAGRVMKAWSIKSTGSTLLDEAALENARQGEYVAERAQCSPVAGDYKLEVEFSLTK